MRESRSRFEASSAAPKAGGSLTVLEGAGFAGDWPAGLDPATNINGAADQSYMDAVYGELFELGPKGAPRRLAKRVEAAVTFPDGVP